MAALSPLRPNCHGRRKRTITKRRRKISALFAEIHGTRRHAARLRPAGAWKRATPGGDRRVRSARACSPACVSRGFGLGARANCSGAARLIQLNQRRCALVGRLRRSCMIVDSACLTPLLSGWLFRVHAAPGEGGRRSDGQRPTAFISTKTKIQQQQPRRCRCRSATTSGTSCSPASASEQGEQEGDPRGHRRAHTCGADEAVL